MISDTVRTVISGLILFLITPALALAQTGTVEGTVTDAETDVALPGATIVVAGTSIGAAADVEGAFSLSGIPEGTHVLQASFVGYLQDTVFLERDKELFTQGLRLPDQRRVTLEEIAVDVQTHGWHRSMPVEGSFDSWWYLPITLDERDDNPNLPSS